MGKLTGAILTAAGVAVGAYAVYSYELNSYEYDAIVVTPPPPPAKVLATAQVSTSDRTRPDNPASVTGRLPAGVSWEGTVTLSPRVPTSDIRSSSPAAPPRVPVGRQMATIEGPMDHLGLARELQRQLRRVGCYEGEINGIWTPSTRRAMKAFIDRVNAALPIEQPNSILLAIVQNHQGEACGTSCPAGQALAADGRCLPSALIARAAKRPAPVDNSGSYTANAAAPSDGAVPIAPGRMGLAGPQPEPSPLAADARAHGPYLSPPDVAAQDGPPVRSARPPSTFDARARERRRERGWVQRAFPSSLF